MSQALGPIFFSQKPDSDIDPLPALESIMENTTALVSLLCALFTAYTGSPAAVSAANSRGDFSISDWACIPCLPVLCIAGDGTLSVDPNGCWEKDARLVQLQDFVRGYNSTH